MNYQISKSFNVKDHEAKVKSAKKKEMMSTIKGNFALRLADQLNKGITQELNLLSPPNAS